MPELAEVEVARRNLVRWWEGRAAGEVLVLDPKLLVATDEGALVEVLQTPLEAMKRRGKYLIGHFEDGRAVVFHFRMTGKIIRCDRPEARFARLAWYVAPGTGPGGALQEGGWLVFKDQRRLGHVELFEPGALAGYAPLAMMGPEPYDLTVEAFRARVSPRRNLKAALLDQSVVAGVGNIAITELFWRSKIAPRAKMGELSEAQVAALVEDMPRYFDEVIAVSQADEIVYLEEGNAENTFDVYGREGEPCPRCAATIVREVIGGRSSFYCPSCQA